MSFQAYLDNIRAKTGKTPEQLKALAVKAGVYSRDMKATALVAWLLQNPDRNSGANDPRRPPTGGTAFRRRELPVSRCRGPS
jgi:hypothetical protein